MPTTHFRPADQDALVQRLQVLLLDRKAARSWCDLKKFGQP
jgi:hypothetical protein